jgi:ACS family tartrate transporter-like MFS transporter
MPTRLLEPGTAAASVGFINLIANFGGFAGPYALGFLTDRTGTYLAGVLFLVSSAVLAAVILAFLPGRASKSGLSEPVRYSSAKAT